MTTLGPLTVIVDDRIPPDALAFVGPVTLHPRELDPWIYATPDGDIGWLAYHYATMPEPVVIQLVESES